MSPGGRWTEVAALTRQRDRSLDVAKGLAITAIVVSHVLRGLASPDTVPRLSAAFLEVDDGLYAWHVALFAVVAGAFLPSGVERRGALAYLRPRVLLFTWLYLLWTVLQAGQQQLEAALAGDPVDVHGFLQSFLTAYGQLWWLAFMVLAMVVSVVARPWRTPGRAVASSVAVGAASVAAWGWSGPWVFEEGLALIGFFWIGLLLGRDGLSRLTASPLTPWCAIVGLAAGVALLVGADPMPPTSWLGTRTTEGVALGVAASVALCTGVLALAGTLARTPLVGPLALLGERSLEIFVAHLLAIAAADTVLARLGVENLATVVAVATTAGLALPLGVWWLGRRVGLPWLFTSPLR